MTPDAEGFIGLQWLARSGVSCRLNPSSHLAAVNPDMMRRISPMRQPFLHPLAHSVRRDVQFLRQFRRGIQHWQQAWRTDDGSMGQAIFHERVCASQVDFCS
jgi:hypothetical protein